MTNERNTAYAQPLSLPCHSFCVRVEKAKPGIEVHFLSQPPTQLPCHSCCPCAFLCLPTCLGCAYCEPWLPHQLPQLLGGAGSLHTKHRSDGCRLGVQAQRGYGVCRQPAGSGLGWKILVQAARTQSLGVQGAGLMGRVKVEEDGYRSEKMGTEGERFNGCIAGWGHRVRVGAKVGVN